MIFACVGESDLLAWQLMQFIKKATVQIAMHLFSDSTWSHFCWIVVDLGFF